MTFFIKNNSLSYNKNVELTAKLVFCSKYGNLKGMKSAKVEQTFWSVEKSDCLKNQK